MRRPNTDLAKRHLGWQPTDPLDEGLTRNRSETVTWRAITCGAACRSDCDGRSKSGDRATSVAGDRPSHFYDATKLSNS